MFPILTLLAINMLIKDSLNYDDIFKEEFVSETAEAT